MNAEKELLGGARGDDGGTPAGGSGKLPAQYLDAPGIMPPPGQAGLAPNPPHGPPGPPGPPGPSEAQAGLMHGLMALPMVPMLGDMAGGTMAPAGAGAANSAPPPPSPGVVAQLAGNKGSDAGGIKDGGVLDASGGKASVKVLRPPLRTLLSDENERVKAAQSAVLASLSRVFALALN